MIDLDGIKIRLGTKQEVTLTAAEVEYLLDRINELEETEWRYNDLQH